MSDPLACFCLPALMSSFCRLSSAGRACCLSVARSGGTMALPRAARCGARLRCAAAAPCCCSKAQRSAGSATCTASNRGFVARVKSRIRDGKLANQAVESRGGKAFHIPERHGAVRAGIDGATARAQQSERVEVRPPRALWPGRQLPVASPRKPRPDMRCRWRHTPRRAAATRARPPRQRPSRLSRTKQPNLMSQQQCVLLCAPTAAARAASASHPARAAGRLHAAAAGSMREHQLQSPRVRRRMRGQQPRLSPLQCNGAARGRLPTTPPMRAC